MSRIIGRLRGVGNNRIPNMVERGNICAMRGGGGGNRGQSTTGGVGGLATSDARKKPVAGGGKIMGFYKGHRGEKKGAETNAKVVNTNLDNRRRYNPMAA